MFSHANEEEKKPAEKEDRGKRASSSDPSTSIVRPFVPAVQTKFVLAVIYLLLRHQKGGQPGMKKRGGRRLERDVTAGR